jgi:hypothetical protein
MTTSAPTIQILNDPDLWEVLDGDARWQGENLWEIYFNIATQQEKPAMPRIQISVEGVEPGRVIVGNTDVLYEYEDSEVRFQMVNDKGIGQLIETYWQDPRGGLPIYLRHNWEMRKVGPWYPWPENAIRSVDNFLFAARETLRLMDDLSGHIGLEVMITDDGGLMLRAKPDANCYYLRPHKDGGHSGVSVFRGDEHICHVSTMDDASTGEMIATVKYADKTRTEEILYDPFTGRLRRD